jgi:regulatory protein
VPGRRRAPDYSGDPVDIRRAAMDLLSRREHCTAEIRAKLRARFGEDAPVDSELQRLSGDGLLSDERFAEAFVRMHRNRGHGPLRILRELEQRGVDRELAEASVAAGGSEWLELARAWKQRRFGAEEPASAAEWQRAARQLQQRGFTSEQIRFALAREADVSALR